MQDSVYIRLLLGFPFPSAFLSHQSRSSHQHFYAITAKDSRELPWELTSVILQLEESTGSIAVDQIGRSVILYRPSTSKMKKRQEVAENARRFARAKEENARRFVNSEESFEERPRNSTGRRFVKSGSTFSSQQKRRPMASKGSSYSRG